MNVLRPLLIVLALIAALAGDATFVVADGEQSVVSRFGEPIGTALTEPGRYFKAPAVDQIRRFPRDPLLYEEQGIEVTGTGDAVSRLDVLVRWQVADAVRFWQGLNDLERARSRLAGAVRKELQESVAGASPEVPALTSFWAEGLPALRREVGEWGIQVLDLEVSPSMADSELAG